MIKNTDPPPSQQHVLLAKTSNSCRGKPVFVSSETIHQEMGPMKALLTLGGQEVLKQGSEASLCTKNFTQTTSAPKKRTVGSST